MSRFMTLQETAAYLSLPLSMVYRLSHEGRLPGKIVWGAKTVRVDREALDQYLAEEAGGAAHNRPAP